MLAAVVLLAVGCGGGQGTDDVVVVVGPTGCRPRSRCRP